MDTIQLRELLDKYLSGLLSADEKLLLQDSLNDARQQDLIIQMMESDFLDKRFELEEDGSLKEKIWSGIKMPAGPAQIHTGKSKYTILRTLRWAKAAAVILLIGTIIFLFNKKTVDNSGQKVAQVEIPAGSNRATLILSDGKRIDLYDSAKQSITDGAITINKEGAVIDYNAMATPVTNTVAYNTMITPRGGQYQLVLPDGSKVWLNSASSLKYPIVFTGKERIVELTGEAYFEIKKNEAMPFFVKANKVDVAVLGTEFNINSYEDEHAISTTLIGGSVKVSGNKQLTILKPGQQANFSVKNNTLSVNTNPDTRQVLAWQRGMFEFRNASIDDVMRQVKRWYDVEVIYKGDLPAATFGGVISRKVSLSELLELFDENGFIFQIKENRQLIISGKK